MKSLEFFAEIIEAAGTLPGLIALAMLVLGSIALVFFSKDNAGVRLIAFALLLFGFGLAIFAVFSLETKKPDGEKVPKKPEGQLTTQCPDICEAETMNILEYKECRICKGLEP